MVKATVSRKKAAQGKLAAAKKRTTTKTSKTAPKAASSKGERAERVAKLTKPAVVDRTPVPLEPSAPQGAAFPTPKGCGVVAVEPPDWVVAIPSYKRATKLAAETLAFLGRQRIAPERIYLCLL